MNSSITCFGWFRSIRAIGPCRHLAVFTLTSDRTRIPGPCHYHTGGNGLHAHRKRIGIGVLALALLVPPALNAAPAEHGGHSMTVAPTRPMPLLKTLGRWHRPITTRSP